MVFHSPPTTFGWESGAAAIVIHLSAVPLTFPMPTAASLFVSVNLPAMTYNVSPAFSLVTAAFNDFHGAFLVPAALSSPVGDTQYAGVVGTVVVGVALEVVGDASVVVVDRSSDFGTGGAFTPVSSELASVASPPPEPPLQAEASRATAHNAHMARSAFSRIIPREYARRPNQNRHRDFGTSNTDTVR